MPLLYIRELTWGMLLLLCCRPSRTHPDVLRTLHYKNGVMLHEASEICPSCQAELSELYFSIHGVDLYELLHARTISSKQHLELFRMIVHLEPEWSDEFAATEHEMDHFRHLAYPPACPATCRRAQALYKKAHPESHAWNKGGGKCASCIKLHGVVKQVGEEQLLSELIRIYTEDSTMYADIMLTL